MRASGGIAPRAPRLRHGSRARPLPSIRAAFVRASHVAGNDSGEPAGQPERGEADHLRTPPGAQPLTRTPHALHEHPTTHQPPQRETPRGRDHRARGVSSPPRPAPHTRRGQRRRNPPQAKKTRAAIAMAATGKKMATTGKKMATTGKRSGSGGRGRKGGAPYAISRTDPRKSSANATQGNRGGRLKG